MMKPCIQFKWNTSKWVWCILCVYANSCSAYSSHLEQSMRVAANMVGDVAVALGIFLIFGALMKLKRIGERGGMMQQQMTAARPIAMIVVGALFLCFPATIHMCLLILFGSSSPMAYTELITSKTTQIIAPVVALLELLGIIGLMRGLMLMSRLGTESGQPGTIGKAMLHIIGGLMCINVMGVYSMFRWMLN